MNAQNSHIYSEHHYPCSINLIHQYINVNYWQQKEGFVFLHTRRLMMNECLKIQQQIQQIHINILELSLFQCVSVYG